jgi:release factor glutamine methyltransferase
VSAAADTEANVCVGAVRRAAADALRCAGVDSPELDARLILGHALALDQGELGAAASRLLAPAERRSIADLVARRLGGEPVARILGRREFWGLDLRVTPATLVPRPETETVVEAALAAIDAAGRRQDPIRLADIGTGSGAILLALLSELPRAVGIGTDCAEPALVTARDNARRLGLAARAAFVAGSFTAALRGPFDVVVANPPYIRSGDIAGLAAEVREHDPRRALDGGADGLAAYRAIITDLRRVLRTDGSVVFELGAGQDNDVTQLLSQAGLMVSARRRDLAGIVRAVIARF